MDITTPIGPMKSIEGTIRINPQGDKFVYLWNNDLDQQRGTVLEIKGIASDLGVYDLFTFEKIGNINQKHYIWLAPGDGIILAICDQGRFDQIHQAANKIKIETELIKLDCDIEKFKSNELSFRDIKKNLESIKKEKTSTDETDVKSVIIKQQQILVRIKEQQTYFDDARKALLNSSSIVGMIEQTRKNLGVIHKILCDRLEASFVGNPLYKPNPFSVLKQPGRSYAENALLLSLAFRNVCTINATGQGDKVKAEVELLAEMVEKFVRDCEELKKHKPKISEIQKSGKEQLISLIGEKYWKEKLRWLESGNGISNAIKEKKKALEVTK